MCSAWRFCLLVYFDLSPRAMMCPPRGHPAFTVGNNLFVTLERTRFLFRDMLTAVRHLVELKVDPSVFWRKPWRYRDVPRTLWFLRPRWVRSGPVLARRTRSSELPQLVCWPRDG